jgi:hypothetical protein
MDVAGKCARVLFAFLTKLPNVRVHVFELYEFVNEKSSGPPTNTVTILVG